MSYKRWTFAQVNKDLASTLSAECGLDPMLCLLMTGRGIPDADAAMEFLVGNELYSDPFMFADMDAAVERVQRAVDEGESIMVYGDYDCDGVTATVLLFSYLKRKGARVAYRLPRRDVEGYGLNCDVIDDFAAEGVQLIVTVDNGISAAEEVEYAAERGIDVVVTDHHQPPKELPKAIAVVDPHRADCPSEFKGFAGVGMAFQLVCALEGDPDWAIAEYGDLVALGTLADVMPLRADNRVLVRRGLQRINAQTRLGLRMLRLHAGVGEQQQNATGVTFTLAPRINAAGRMGDPNKAAALLLSENEEEADALAREICELNVERQTTETAILDAVMKALGDDPTATADRVLVVWGNGWHHGVLGILAARLQERYGKPCLVLSVDDGIARGSGRSISGFSLYDALSDCEDVLLGYGGHELAAGVTLEASRMEEFRERINAYAARTFPRMPIAQVRMDCRLKPNQIKPELLTALSAMEPFGAENPAPLFGLYRMTIERIEPVGGGKHLRLTVTRDGTRLTAMKFSTTAEEFPFMAGDTVHLSVSLDKNEYRGVVGVSVIVRDIRYAQPDQETVIAALARRDGALRRDLSASDAVAPDRDCAAAVYRLLKKGSFCGSAEQLMHLVPSFDGAAVLIAVTMLSEAGLIDYRYTGDVMHVSVRPVDGKTDLMSVPTARYLLGLEG